MPKKLTLEDFISKAKKAHGDRYNYSKVEYVNNSSNVCIICPEHGEFWQRPDKHLIGHGCPKCCKTGIRSNTEQFIEKAKKVHGNKYDYSKVVYINNHTKVCIICSEHGEFWQTPNSHLNGNGCFGCSYIKRGKEKRLTTDEFIKRSKKIHGDKYDYSKVEYSTWFEKVPIICPRHGEFMQTPSSHLNGFGCPKCHQSIMERKVEMLLKENNIKYIFECSKKHLPWLDRLRIDFYLPEYNIGIECQGKQHFLPIDRFGGEIGLKKRIKADNKKRKLCQENGVKIIYYANYNYNFPYNVLTDENKLLESISSLVV